MNNNDLKKIYNLQIPCKNLSDNQTECLNRPDCYLKKGKTVSKRQRNRGKTSKLICVRKNNIPLDFQQIQKIFIGRGLCWLHTSIIALFVSDIFRDKVWQKCFVLKKFNDLIIPTKTKFIEKENTGSEGLFYYTLVDLIRLALMQMFKNLSFEKTYTFEKNKISENTLEQCNDTMKEILCDLAQRVIELPKEDIFCDQFGGTPYDFINEFLNYFDLSYENVKIYFPPEKNKFFDINDLKEYYLEDFDIFFTESVDHVLLFFKFNNEWSFYDNNMGSILKVNNINNNNTLLDLIINLKVESYHKNFHKELFNRMKHFVAIQSTNLINPSIKNEYLKLERINYISENLYQNSLDNYINTLLTTKNYGLLNDLRVLLQQKMISFIKLYNKNEKDIFFYINKKIRPRMNEIKDNNFKKKYIKYKKKYLDLKIIIKNLQ